MDDLRTTLATFSPEDRKDFIQFIQRQKRKQKGRMDLRLCELLLHQKQYTTPELLTKLYPEEPNATAYYALRKRLLRHLTDYLLLRQRQHDPTAASSVRSLLTLAQYLFEAGVQRLAWNTLRKAENLARVNEQYDLLNTVYNVQIAQAGSEHADPLEDIIRRRNLNKKAADEEERAGIADSLIRQRLRQARVKGRGGESFDGILQDVLREYDLQEAFARRPAVLYRLMSISRNAVLVRRDFASFTPFVLRCYHLMEKRHGFQPAHRYYQAGLLYMIAHALYRVRRFEESVQYLGLLLAALAEEGGASYRAEWLPRYTFLLAANYAFMRRNADSIRLLEQALKPPVALSPRDQLTARLGLAFHYFAEGKFTKTNQTLINMGRSDHWCEQEMGLEWLVNKNIGEMLAQFEMGNSDLALNRLRAIERLLRERSGDSEAGPYAHVLTYLDLVREIIDDPDAIRHPSFVERVYQMPDLVPRQREDLQLMSFYAWLRARTLHRPYYEVLLELADVPSVAELKKPLGKV